MTHTPASPPAREWTFYVYRGGQGLCWIVQSGPPVESGETVHVIEYSAFEAMRERNANQEALIEKLQRKLERVEKNASANIAQAFEERDEALAKLRAIQRAVADDQETVHQLYLERDRYKRALDRAIEGLQYAEDPRIARAEIERILEGKDDTPHP